MNYYKKKRQGGSVEVWATIGICMFMFLATAMVILHSKQIGDLQENDKCIIEYVNKIQPDPNETEERSLLLKECMDK